jgi:cardiolipin synthase
MEFSAFNSNIDHDVMGRWLRHLPNVISSIRIVLVVPLVMVLTQHRPIATLWLFAVAAASDGIDGFLARRFGWQSDLGGLLDPIADKVMLATVFVVLAFLGSVPVWLAAAVIARDAIIVTGAVSYRVLFGPVPARPSPISKVNTLCQIAFILSVIGAQEFAWVAAGTLPLGALVFVTVVVSGIDYVLVYGRQAAAEARARRGIAGARGTKAV